MQCHACNGILNNKDNYLKCSACTSLFHCECLNIKRDQLLKLKSKFIDSWICPACSNTSRRKNTNLCTPVRRSPEPLVDNSSNVSNEKTERECAPGDVTMDKISNLLELKLKQSLAEFSDNFKLALKEEVKSIVRSEMQSIIDKLKDDFTVTTDHISAVQINLNEEIKLKNKLIGKLQTENSKLLEDIKRIDKRLFIMERNSRNMNVELQLIPESHKEDTATLFRNLCKLLQVSISDSDIVSCRRVAKMNKSSNRPRNILVSLSSFILRDTIISAAHRFNKAHPNDALNATQLGLTGGKIYVCEHLTPELKILHSATRNACKEKSYKFVWIKYGRIYVRKDENSIALHIGNMEALSKL